MDGMAVDFPRRRIMQALSPELPTSTCPEATQLPLMDLSTALSILRPPISSSFPQFTSFPFADPSAFLAFTQHLQNAQKYPASSLAVPSAPSATSVKRVALNVQPPASPQSCSSSSIISSSPQQSPQRKQAAPIPDNKKDDAYYERRRKNNDAAKRSRDARRQKEEAIAARAAFLEQENIQLRSQVALLKNETAKLHLMLFSQPKVFESFQQLKNEH
uniref:BZIP domain-containing protein n=1 Tax=Parascaris univalens TaxID=6257 RepID=A0A915B1Q4_PARUN